MREPCTAFVSEFFVMEARIRKKSEALEDSAVAKLVCTTDQQSAIGVLACEIVTQAISHVIDTAPTSGDAIISTSVRAGSEMDTLAEPRQRAFNPNKRLGFILCSKN